MNNSINSARFICGSINQYASSGISAISAVLKNDVLSIESFKLLQSCQRSFAYINRMTDLFSYLTEYKDCLETTCYAFYDADRYISSLCSAMQTNALSFSELEVIYISKLKPGAKIVFDKIRIQEIIYSIFYSFMRLEPTRDNKIFVTLTENKLYNIISIKDTFASLSDDIVKNIFNSSHNIYLTELNFSADALSLALAQSAAKEMGGYINYSALKTCNKTELFIPKSLENLVNCLNESSTPPIDISLLKKIFAQRLPNEKNDDTLI